MRIILHIDMDSFFAAVEARENLALRGKPVVVGADPKGGFGRGVVSTASYEARAFGIRSGMPISRAYRLCPDAVFLPVNFALYERVSGEIMSILRKYADRFQQVSVDEAYLDVSRTGGFEAARELAYLIKSELLDKQKLTSSIGIGPGKLVAKIASDMQKPDGLTVVEPEHVREFLSPLPVRKIPGIGKKTELALARIDIHTIGELAAIDVQLLMEKVGRWGSYLHEAALGIDESEVREEYGWKSIGREVTFEHDTTDREVLARTLDALAEEAHAALKAEGYLFRTVSIKVRYEDFETHTKEKTLEHLTSELDAVRSTAKELLSGFTGSRKIRLLGVRLTKLEKVNTRQTEMGEFGG
ncbi:MAG TPA: DNA polymerase IV [Candidatus Methanoperedenaceae archaeon]|nr:DNA polymerase IV [Candidatus Methanoperedenaceae archaeon]